MEKFELLEKREFLPLANPMYKLSMTSMVWNISIGQLAFAWLCSLAKHGKVKKVLDFLATAKNISVLSTFFSY